MPRKRGSGVVETLKPPTIGVGRVRGRRRVTMTDVARAAGCSQSTVSFVLNNNSTVQISDEMRERVKRVADDLGYEGMPTAPRAEGNSTTAQVIAFVVDSLSTSWEAPAALAGIRQAAGSAGALVVAAETQNDPRLEPKTLSLLIEQEVEAIVYACAHTREVVLPDVLAATDIPVYLLNCHTKDNVRPAVVPSEIAGGQRATNVLVDAGHTRIATITGEPYMAATGDRLTGYRRALATADIPFDPNLVVEGDWSASAGFNGTMKLLELDRAPTAIFCQNDRMAIGCYEALKENGYAIPDDMSVVGYDDEEISRHLFPPLTTVVLPHRAMGIWVVEQHVHPPARHDDAFALTKLECELVERNSVAAPRR